MSTGSIGGMNRAAFTVFSDGAPQSIANQTMSGTPSRMGVVAPVFNGWQMDPLDVGGTFSTTNAYFSWDSTASNTINCLAVGFYRAVAQVEFAANTTGQRVLRLDALYGTTYSTASASGSGTNPIGLVAMTGVFYVNRVQVGQTYVSMLVGQNSGGALNIHLDTTSYATQLQVAYLGPN